ncbi:alpha/beta fold hydrolase [Microbacterium gilvum]|uniref:Alpha/beta hydrolase n=1 Tax=Microbacterium gilvum TaxID=1336204 RepID=A0ABP8ZTA0_9MICO
MRITELDLPFAVTESEATEGDPIIVLPGGPCRGPEYLGDLAGLGRARRMVVLHPRGAPLSGGRSRGWWTDADDVIALVDALDVPRADILAHSAGTRLALATATRQPDRVRSLALVTPPASWLTGSPYDGDAIRLDSAIPAVRDALRSLEHDEPETEGEFRAAFLRQAPATYAHWTDVEEAHSRVGAVSLAAARAWFDGVPADAVERILAAPLPRTLVVGGDGDALTGVQPVADYADALSAKLAMIDDCGHYPWVEQPDGFRRIVDAWLTETGS